MKLSTASQRLRLCPPMTSDLPEHCGWSSRAPSWLACLAGCWLAGRTQSRRIRKTCKNIWFSWVSRKSHVLRASDQRKRRNTEETSKLSPQTIQNRSKFDQNRIKFDQNRAKIDEHRSKIDQNRLSATQDARKTSQERPGSAQERHKKRPRAQRRPQELPRGWRMSRFEVT